MFQIPAIVYINPFWVVYNNKENPSSINCSYSDKITVSFCSFQSYWLAVQLQEICGGLQLPVWKRNEPSEEVLCMVMIHFRFTLHVHLREKHMQLSLSPQNSS